MWRDIGISERDWAATPQVVRTALLALQQQVRLMGIRCAAYEQELASLREQATQVDDLKAEVAESRARLGQNSSNSSKPPSSDPPSYKRKPPQESRGRKRGGQPGHQVSEVPPVRVEVTGYRRHALRCRGCGTLTRAGWPAGVAGTSFGPRAQAVVGYLTGRLGASHRDVSEAMSALYGLSVSAGSVSTIQRQVCRAHLARDFQSMVDRGCESAATGEALSRQAKQLFKLWHKARDGGLSRERMALAMGPVCQKVKKLLEAGACSPQKKTRRTCANILAVERSLWTFLRVRGVEPTKYAKCKRVIRLAEDGYSMKGGKYYCYKCSRVDLSRLLG